MPDVTLSQIVAALRPRRVRLAALWEAVTETCEACGGTGRREVFPRREDGPRFRACVICHTLGRLYRYTTGWPDGAVAGALGKQANEYRIHAATALADGDADAWVTFNQWADVVFAARVFNDQAALAATLATVEGTPVDEDTEAEAR